MGDNHYRAVFFQAIVKRAGVPIMHGLALLLAACVGHAAERIIDQRDMCTAPHERATDTGREVAATGVGHPTAFSLAVLGQSRLENLRILGRGIRLRTSRPKSSAKVTLALAEINCLSGWRPRYQAGKRREANSDLP